MLTNVIYIWYIWGDDKVTVHISNISFTPLPNYFIYSYMCLLTTYTIYQ